MEQTITSIFRNDKDKNGAPLKTKIGKPYVRVNIKTDAHGDKYISGFGNAENANWKIGDKINVLVEQRGEYLNFSMPRKEGFDAERFVQSLHTIIEQNRAILDEVQILRKDTTSIKAEVEAIRWDPEKKQEEQEENEENEDVPE